MSLYRKKKTQIIKNNIIFIIKKNPINSLYIKYLCYACVQSSMTFFLIKINIFILCP